MGNSHSLRILQLLVLDNSDPMVAAIRKCCTCFLVSHRKLSQGEAYLEWGVADTLAS